MLSSITLDAVKDSDYIKADALPFVGFSPIGDSNKLDASSPTEIKEEPVMPKAE